MMTISAKFNCVATYNTKEMRDAKSAFANEMGSRCGTFAVMRTFADHARGMFEPFLNKYGYEWNKLCNTDGKVNKAKFNSAMLDLLKQLAPQMYKDVQDDKAENGIMRTAIVNWRRVDTDLEYSVTKKNGETVKQYVKEWDGSSVFNESRWTVNRMYKVLQYSETFKANGCLGSMEVNTIEDKIIEAPAPIVNAEPTSVEIATA